jgi:hypothetical protein
MENIKRLLDELDRVLTHLAHHIPAETTGVDELRRLSAEVRRELETKKPAR